MKVDRIDRSGLYTAPIWVGLLITGLYILFHPQVEFGISNFEENLLGLLFSAGAAACVAGLFINDWRTAYKVEIAGLVVICAVLGLLAFATDLPLLQQFTMAGGLGALVQIGSLRAITVLGSALLRDK